MNASGQYEKQAPIQIPKITINKPQVINPDLKKRSNLEDIEKLEGIIKSLTSISLSSDNENDPLMIALIQTFNGELISARIEESGPDIRIGSKAIIHKRKQFSANKKGKIHYGFKAQLVD